jgi:hypothetical protein
MSCATTPYEVEPLMKKVDKPVVLAIGQQDEQFIPEKVIAYKQHIMSSVYSEIVNDAGHISILVKAPALIARYCNSFLMMPKNEIKTR